MANTPPYAFYSWTYKFTREKKNLKIFRKKMRKGVAERYTEAFQKKSGGKTMALKKYRGGVGVVTTPPGNPRVKFYTLLLIIL